MFVGALLRCRTVGTVNGQWPNLIVGGTQKAGTTWLHRALDAHPDVEMSSPKELYYFGKPDVDDPDRQAWYREHFSSMTTRYRGEATSNYLWRKTDAPSSPKPDDRNDTARSIRRLLGDDVVVFVLLRSPVERAVAGANHQLTMGRLGADDDIITSAPPLGVVDLGFYGRHVEHWLDVLGEQVVPLIFDDLASDPGGVLEHVCSRLDLDMAAIPVEQRDEILRPTHTRAQIRQSRDVQDAPTFTVRRRDVEHLLELYRDDIELLESLLGRRFEDWTNLDGLAEALVNAD